MTQKELLYVEDAINHEKVIISNIHDMIDNLESEELIDYMNKEVKLHEKKEKEFIELLEDYND